MHIGNTSAPSSSPLHAGAGVLFRWNSATPYLTGGIVFIMLLIAVALIILFCQDRRRSAGEKSSRGAQVTGSVVPLPEFVVIMAGDDKPTYLAMPAAVSSSPEAVVAMNSVAGESSIV